MRERPLLYSAPMVRATLDDLKTMTRRGVTRLTGFGQITEFQPSGTPGYVWTFRDREMRWHDISHERLLECCPYGQPGDHLWVREAWSAPAIEDHLPPRECSRSIRFYEVEHGKQRGLNPRIGKLRPSMFMPRWHSRITLEVAEVRVERLQDISEADAIAEGIEKAYIDTLGRQRWAMYPHDDGVPGDDVVRYCGPTHTSKPIESFRSLWLSINGPGSWSANPWVWCISFRRIKP